MTQGKPDWIRSVYRPQATAEIRALMAQQGLHTVCDEANCPNLGACYGRRTATFMLLGNLCTRDCRFCNVVHGVPAPPDPEEPRRLAETARALQLRHVVVTSVTRDDLTDGGASQFAATVRALRAADPDITVELLVPDFGGQIRDLDTVLAARPDVLNHNLETVRALYSAVRPGADYARSLALLTHAKRHCPGVRTKSGLMVGLGETEQQMAEAMDDLRAAGCDILTVGQYLRPSERHLAVQAYVSPAQFEDYRRMAEDKGFAYVVSGPLVRSSYRAEEALRGQEALS
ncbi:MAG: lipoyl synthase [Oscillospiraceae bacterium]|jgi:lipoic acid synthetase|nr:lipoyl synthase [Oscillospiraceae bacterium]